MTFSPKPDPPVKANGKCVVCNKSRPTVAVEHKDPFCSTACAWQWHHE